MAPTIPTGATAPPLYSGPAGPVVPVQAGPSAAAEFSEPPPSYEESMADNVPVFNAQGPRDGYRPPPPAVTDVVSISKLISICDCG
jgi:hypothetical protein